MVVSTHLKNISQNGNPPQIGVKIKNIWNHHLVFGYHHSQLPMLINLWIDPSPQNSAPPQFQGSSLDMGAPCSTWAPVIGKSLYKPFIVGIYGLKSPRIPREHNKYNGSTRTLGVHLSLSLDQCSLSVTSRLHVALSCWLPWLPSWLGLHHRRCNGRSGNGAAAVEDLALRVLRILFLVKNSDFGYGNVSIWKGTWRVKFECFNQNTSS